MKTCRPAGPFEVDVSGARWVFVPFKRSDWTPSKPPKKGDLLAWFEDGVPRLAKFTGKSGTSAKRKKRKATK